MQEKIEKLQEKLREIQKQGWLPWKYEQFNIDFIWDKINNHAADDPYSIDDLIFGPSGLFEFMFGDEFIYPDAKLFSSTGYVRQISRFPGAEVEIYIKDYHRMLMVPMAEEQRAEYLLKILEK